MAEIAVTLAISKGEWLVGQIANKLYTSISGELSLLLGVRQEIVDIIDELEIMSLFIREAEEQQANDELAKAWVKQVRQLAYAVEDCIDEFSLRLEHRSARRNYVTAALRRLARSLGSIGVRHRIAAEIQSIKYRVEKVSNRRLRYGITKPSKASSGDNYNIAQYDPRLAALFVEDSQLVGINGPRDHLVEWLLDEVECQLRVIAVVGGGGLGKTTLARKVYESPNVTDGRFTCRAWISVSQVYHIDGLLRDMIRQVIPSPKEDQPSDQLTKDLDNMGRDQLITKLREYLKDKRYIISFDDIWKIDAWKSLTLALPNNNLGSRVMLTTRNNEVAEACCTQIPDRIYQHEKLSFEQSMELFCRRVFDSPEHTCPEDLKRCCEDILEICDGLPLTIVSIAGVLASKPKKTSEEWNDMLGRLGAELEHNLNLEGMKQILNFSYNDLPYHVKRCFLYLGKFPEDYLVNRKRIQRLWIAEGLVAGHRDMTAEEVAESYFNELINRFMILPSAFSANGKVKSFRVHDIMLEMIVSKSMDDNFVSLLRKNSIWIPQDMIRRLSIHAQNKQMNMNLSQVRSLSMFGEDTQMLISSSLGRLRVLDLDGCDALENNHLKIVMKFLHLKYLSLRNTRVSKLPNSLGNLRNLESLDFRRSNIIQIPEGIIKLEKLRFLCGGLCDIPRGVGSLRALQELADACARSSSKDVVEEFRKLTQLRKLAVSNLPEESGKFFCDSLKSMSRSLRSLHVHSLSTLAFLNNVSSPPLLLESLKLDGQLGELPSWVCSLSNVVKIFLRWSEFGDDAVKALGTLPNLIQLKLGFDAYKEESLCLGDEGFLELKMLHLEHLSLTSLSFKAEALQNLEMFSMTSCFEKQSRRVSVLGIANLRSLKEIKTSIVHKEDLVAINTQANDHPNHPRLIASRIFHIDDTGVRQWE